MKKLIIITLTTLCAFIYASAQTYTLRDEWVSCGKDCQLLDPYFAEGVTFTWTGGSVSGKAHGKGVAKRFVNGELESSYEGEYRNGIREGHGKVTLSDGTIKEGNFENGQLMGYGTAIFQDGDEYRGNFINYCMHGEGTLRYGNGTVFDGFMVDDAPYTGKITYYDGAVSYIQAYEKVDKIKEKKQSYSPTLGVVQTEYFDENWERCEPKNAAYYRRVTYKAPNTPDGIVKDYYISGQLQSTFTAIYLDYADEGKNFQEGEATWYYEDGSVEQKRYYYNNLINGPRTYYYKSGLVQSVANYKHGVLDGARVHYDEEGEPSQFACYTDGKLKDSKYLQFWPDGTTLFVYNVDFDEDPDGWNDSGASGNIEVYRDALIFEAYPERGLRTGLMGDIASSTGGGAYVTTYRTSKDCEVTIFLSWGYKNGDNENFIAIYKDEFKYASILRGQQISGNNFKRCPYINDKKNTIGFLYDEDNLWIKINGETVYSDNRPPEVGKGYIIGVYNSSEKRQDPIYMTDFSISESAADLEEVKEYMMSASSSTGWSGNGSGFFVSEDGYIATNYHVIEDATAIEATFQRDGVSESHAATVVLSDKQNDLAILKIDDSFTKMKPLPYNFSTSVKETGSEVFTLGYPIADVMGTEVKYTDGKISSKTGIQGDVTVYQITAPIQPGNSGGPLFDANGSIVGITSSALNKDYFQSENVNYAVKSIYLQSLIDSLPVSIKLQQSAPTANRSITEMVSMFSDYIVLIKVK